MLVRQMVLSNVMEATTAEAAPLVTIILFLQGMVYLTGITADQITDLNTELILLMISKKKPTLLNMA